MIAIRLPAALTVLLIASAVTMGCRQKAQQAGSDHARETLCRAMDAWQKGESLESLQKQTSITAIEPTWQAGIRLVEYEILGDGHAWGFDWQCQVRLSLKDNAGRAGQVKATYSVSTAPALVIVRSEDS